MVYPNGLFTWLMNGLFESFLSTWLLDGSFTWFIWMFIRMVIDGLMVYWIEWFIDMSFDSN